MAAYRCIRALGCGWQGVVVPTLLLHSRALRMVVRKRVAFQPRPTVLNAEEPRAAPAMVRVKAVFGGEVRRFALDAPPTFAALSERVRDAFRLDAFCLKYVDCDGDFVCMSTDLELADAVAAADDGLLRLHILRVAPSPPPTPPPRFGLPPHSRPYHHPIRAYMHPHPHHIRTPPPPPPPPPPTSSSPPPHPRVRPFPMMHQTGPPPPAYAPPPPYSAVEANADRMLDAMLGAVAWLILGFILHQGLPFWVLVIAFVALHRRLRIRPIIKRNVVAMMEASQMLSHPHPPPMHRPRPHSN